MTLPPDTMRPCSCGHTIASHRGYRPEVTNREGCLVEGCACDSYMPGGGNRDKLPQEFHRALNNLRQEFNKKLDALKAEYLKQ